MRRLAQGVLLQGRVLHRKVQLLPLKDGVMMPAAGG